MAKRQRPGRSSCWIVAIGVFKLIKGLGLLAIALGLFSLIHKDVAAVLERWITVLRMDPDNRHIHGVLIRIFNVTPRQLRELSAGTFLYAAIFLTEGAGLLARRSAADTLIDAEPR